MLERLYVKGPNRILATAPNFEQMPESLKPISYPFDYAWQKTQELKTETATGTGAAAVNTAANAAGGVDDLEIESGAASSSAECIAVGAN